MAEGTLNRKIYISDEQLCLCQYLPESDDRQQYECWQEEDTQKGYNFVFKETFEEFTAGAIKSRFIAAIVRKEDRAIIGSIFVSPENTLPDLAIMIYKPFRGMGYGTRAFSLGVKYSLEVLGLDKIYAGCYPDNERSMKMLKKCGFVPHPEGNVAEKHYRTGEPIMQLDFVKYND